MGYPRLGSGIWDLACWTRAGMWPSRARRCSRWRILAGLGGVDHDVAVGAGVPEASEVGEFVTEDTFVLVAVALLEADGEHAGVRSFRRRSSA